MFSTDEKNTLEVKISKREEMLNLEHGSLYEAFHNDNVFQVVKDGEGPDFRGVGTISGGILIAKSCVGIGVLGLPSSFEVLGFVPGLISLVGLCLLSLWTGLVIGKFRMNHPLVYGVDDATFVVFGSVAKELSGFGFWLFCTLSYGSALLTVGKAFTTITEHAICSLGWVGMTAGIVLIVGISARSLKYFSWASWPAVTSIFVAVWVVAIACLSQDTPSIAKSVNRGPKVVNAIVTGRSFQDIISAISTQLLSLAGTYTYFPIHAEMRKPENYNKSFYIGQGLISFLYIAIGTIIYAKVGQYVASPALASAGVLFAKIGYGIALPGLFFSTFFQSHCAAKACFVRILRGSKHLQSNSPTHWITWASLVTVVVVCGFIIAGAIPFFGDLLSLMGALCGSFFTLILPAFFALYDMSLDDHDIDDNTWDWIRKSFKKWKSTRENLFISIMSLTCIAFGIFILVGGLYGSISSIIDGYRDGTVDRAFSCQ